MTQQRVRRSGWARLLFFTVLGFFLGSRPARAEVPATAVARGAPDDGNPRVEIEGDAALLTAELLRRVHPVKEQHRVSGGGTSGRAG